MKRQLILASLCTIGSLAISAQEVLYIHQGNITTGTPLTSIDSIHFDEEGTKAYFHIGDTIPAFPIAEIDSLSFASRARSIYINYSKEQPSIVNPMAYSGVDVAISGGDVTVNATTDEELEYILSGECPDGSFKIYSNKKFALTLNGVNLTNSDGPAINVQSGKKVSVNLAEGTTNVLTDGNQYTPCGEEDMKATFFSEGQLIFSGKGTLQVTGNKKHGICSDDYIKIEEGNFILKEIASDAIRANDYIQIDGGTLEIAAQGDGMDGDAGFIEINGGTLNIQVAEDTSKGIKCDSIITINGGDITINTTGGVVVEEGDPSYCTGIKTDQTLTINGGNISITSTGEAGKGLSANGDIVVNNGTIHITTAGGGSTYTNTEGELDDYSATCIKADGNLYVYGGSITTLSSGAAGKGISADGDIIFGGEGLNPILDVTTTGKKFYVSGSGEDADYANPKCIKADGNLTIYSGTFTVKGTQDGGEGIESKDTLAINGGTIEIETVDDAINAKYHLAFNGGRVYCYASGNDAVDSNGTISITGGINIFSGSRTPEGGIDCDNSKFSITGGILIATGGSNSTPTASLCTQCCVSYNASSLAGKTLCIQDASGNSVLIYTMPNLSTTAGGNVMLFTTPDLQQGATYTILTNGTAEGGTEWHGYHAGATYSNGTTANTFTTTNMVTNLSGNQGGGGFPGGNRPR